MAVMVWTLGVLAWSAFDNLVLGEDGYVVRNVLLTLTILLIARRLGFSPGALGLSAHTVRQGLRFGTGAAVLVASVLIMAVALADQVALIRELLDDRRADLTTGGLAFAALVQIPLGTVLFEQVLFRGLGLALLLAELRRIPAILVNSAIFGLWHIPPTIVTLRLNHVDPLSLVGIGGVAGSVLMTFFAGVAFAWLRLRTGSLVAPCLAHWATNALGLLAAASQ